MTLAGELSSLKSPARLAVSPAPAVGDKAPSTPELAVPAPDGRPTVVAFLRHCGCPFAEATFLNLRRAAAQHPDVRFVAVSHSSAGATASWVAAVGGPSEPSPSSSSAAAATTTAATTAANPVQVVVDAERRLYARWGLGASSWTHVLSPAALGSLLKLGREKGIWNRGTESGSRWQQGGCWVLDGDGVVLWGGRAARADEAPDVEAVVRRVLEGGGGNRKGVSDG